MKNEKKKMKNEKKKMKNKKKKMKNKKKKRNRRKKNNRKKYMIKNGKKSGKEEENEQEEEEEVQTSQITLPPLTFFPLSRRLLLWEVGVEALLLASTILASRYFYRHCPPHPLPARVPTTSTAAAVSPPRKQLPHFAPKPPDPPDPPGRCLGC